MNSSLTDTIINQLIGAIIGTAVSLITSWYFYKKADFPSKTAGAMTESVLAMIIGTRLGIDFTLCHEPDKKDLPKNLDIPHITQFYCDRNNAKPGDTVSFLIRLEDSGFDLDYGDKGVEVIEASSKVGFPVQTQGHGFNICKVQFPLDAIPGNHTIIFNMVDIKKNKFTQTLKFEILPTKHSA